MVRLFVGLFTSGSNNDLQQAQGCNHGLQQAQGCNNSLNQAQGNPPLPSAC